jgi:hypothetical protein
MRPAAAQRRGAKRNKYSAIRRDCGGLRPFPYLIDESIHLWRKPWLLLVGSLLTPPPLVQVTPTINEFKYADQAFMRESIVHGRDPIAGT